VSRSGGSLRLDVAAAARLQLLAAGLAASALHDVSECTSCRADRYFSHRRDRGVTGRQWGIVALSPPV
jgi:polyphenol oxidase